MAIFGRVITAMVSPFDADGRLNVARAQELAQHLVDNGSEGLVVSGSTGEAATLTDEEKVTLFRAVKDAVGTGVSVIAGAGTYDTAHSIELTREAEKAGCDGVLAVTPYYNRPPQDSLLNHFRAIADASNLPVMLYDVPSRTALHIEIPTLLRAAEHPNIVALKDAAKDLSGTTLFAAQKPDDFDIYSGNDDETLGYQAIGGVGVVSVAAHVMGSQIREQFDAFERGDLVRARAMQFLEREVHAALLASNPISIKAAMNILGFDVGAPRPPLRAATTHEEELIRQALEAVGAF